MDLEGTRILDTRFGGSSVRVVPVDDARKRDRFLRFPYRLYRGDPHWVPPLLSDQRALFDTARNPFYRHAEIRMFLAVREEIPVGRIAGIVNHAHNDYHREKVGFFGFFEVEADPEASSALFDSVEDWLRSRGMECLRGPVNPSMGSECGLLVDGFDSSPAIMMPYNPPHYRERLEERGLMKEMDLLAFQSRTDMSEELEAGRKKLEKVMRLMEKRHPSVKVRPLDRKQLRRDAFILRDVFDGARRRNYGFVPSTDEEYEALVGKMKQIVDPDLIQILEKAGKPVGCAIALPDWNIALKRSERVPYPLRLLRILWERRNITGMRVIAIGILDEFKRSGLIGLMIHRIIENGRRKGYTSAELSWVAEDNTVQIQTLTNLLAPDLFKRYRIYSKPLSD